MKEYFMHPVFDLTVRNRFIRFWWNEYKRRKKALKKVPDFTTIEYVYGEVRYSDVLYAYARWSELINKKWRYSPKGV